MCRGELLSLVCCRFLGGSVDVALVAVAAVRRPPRPGALARRIALGKHVAPSVRFKIERRAVGAFIYMLCACAVVFKVAARTDYTTEQLDFRQRTDGAVTLLSAYCRVLVVWW